MSLKKLTSLSLAIVSILLLGVSCLSSGISAELGSFWATFLGFLSALFLSFLEPFLPLFSFPRMSLYF
jgi:uncharacterized membrane protein